MKKTVRSVVLVLMGITYLFGCGLVPQLMDLWNKDIFIGPFPCFFVGLWLIAGGLVLETLFLFWYERKDNTFED